MNLKPYTTMLDIHTATVIHYPVDVVFPFFTDLRNELSWHPDIVSMEKLSAAPIGLGSTFLANYKQVGNMEIAITRYDENRRADFHCVAKAFTMDMQCQLRPVADGTELDVAMQMQLRGVMRLMKPMIKSKLLKDWTTKATQIEVGIAKAIAGSKQSVAGVAIAA